MRIEDQPLRTVLFLRGAVHGGDLGSTLGRLLPRIYHHVHAAGVVPTLPPFARFVDPRGAEVETGVGVPEGTRAAGELAVGTLPAGPAAVGWHQGDTRGLAGARAALHAEVAASDRWEAAGPGWEIYWDDAGGSPLPALRVQILVPVRPRTPADPPSGSASG